MFGNPPLLSFGSTASVAPVLVSVVDGGDQDSAIATVTGTGTIQLYYRIKGATSWTTGLTRSGDGTITQTGLTANKWYEFYATADQNGIESAPSSIISAYIAGTATTSIERAIFAILSGDDNVSGLVGTGIYPNYVPQNGSMPAITQQEITGPRDYTSDGPSGLVNTRFQINCWATTYSGCDEVSEAVRGVLSGYSGSVGSLAIHSSFLDDERDIPEIEPGKDQLRRMGKGLDFKIWYTET